MANLSAENINQLTKTQLKEVESWLRPLQQALLIEADKGFTNLLGRDQRFNVFMSRQLLLSPNISRNSEVGKCLKELSNSFNEYGSKQDSDRRRLVTKSRQFLHELNRKLGASRVTNKAKLRFESDQKDNDFLHSNTTEHLKLTSLLVDINGVGPKLSERLAVLGIFNIKDLLLHYPRDYVDYSSLHTINQLREGEAATLLATIRRCSTFKSRRNPNLSILEIHLQDQTGRIRISRFFTGRRYNNQSYIHSQIRLYPPGAIVAISGIVKAGSYGLTFKDPVIEVMESKNSNIKSKVIGRLIPVYNLTEGIKSERIRDIIDIILPLAEKWPEIHDNNRLIKLSLPKKKDAIKTIHKPHDQASLQLARRRLIFDEFFILQLGLLFRRASLRKKAAPPLNLSFERDGLVGRFLEMLPFKLTSAQKRVLTEIESDLVKSEPMSRLVQGDVGSGKTVVAIASLLSAVQSGWQGALMAPTEVLAVQHYRTLCKWLPSLHVTVELLTGATSRKRRGQVLDDLTNGSLKILVGTHALIEDPVDFLRLGLVVVDEQHRFGVHQRNRLLAKGLQPHLLTMTATPIPRTLALSIHGDLDISQIDELPPGRTPIKTKLISSSKRDQAYELIRTEVNKGQRAYVVLPLIDESEKLDLRSAIQVHELLSKEVFPEFVVGLLHGRMSSAEKQSVVQAFVEGNCQILVSTTVVEVGVDVPEATVMVVDNADRFGLAQLHQLRGRVGRGAKDSYCLLINENKNTLSKSRLEVLVSSSDGFEIAEIDLRLRGPGQVLGTRQSGLPDLALASLIDDRAVLEEARSEAFELLKADPDLINHEKLKSILEQESNRLRNRTHLN